VPAKDFTFGAFGDGLAHVLFVFWQCHSNESSHVVASEIAHAMSQSQVICCVIGIIQSFFKTTAFLSLQERSFVIA